MPTSKKMKRSRLKYPPAVQVVAADSQCQCFPCQAFAPLKPRKKRNKKIRFPKRVPLNKKRKIEGKEVTIQVGVMNEHFKVKRVETIPLKISSTASAHTILAAAIKKHDDFNRRFENDNGSN